MTGGVYIVDAVRTPFGKYNGALAAVRPDDLAAHVIRELLARSPHLDPPPRHAPPLSPDRLSRWRRSPARRHAPCAAPHSASHAVVSAARQGVQLSPRRARPTARATPCASWHRR